MIIKKGVKIAGLRPEMLVAIIVIDYIYLKFNRELVITSALDGVHSVGSLHYVGLAIDTRTRFFSALQSKQIVVMIRRNLGIEFDVVLEKTHIHIEFQPK